jgi:hypothetical protein
LNRFSLHRVLIVCFCAVLIIGANVADVKAQNAPCGVVDAIDYPIDITDTLSTRYDDFGLFRARFGGRHTGLDIAFRRLGDPVMAAARGIVTYADPEGWDTEKGVVIVRHTFPDGSIYYTLYGHMEQTDTIQFPRVGLCVERGDVVGVVGWPSRGLPHLHYEIRNFLPNDGGPGYVTDNPLLSGWYDPLEFTDLWRIRLQPGYVSSVSFNDVPTLPPVITEDGGSVIANADAIIAYFPDGRVMWRVTTDGVVTALLGLLDGSVLGHTRSGQAMILRGGRYAALWKVEGPDAPVVLLGDTLVFATDGGGLAAFDTTSAEKWTLAGDEDWLGLVDFRGGSTSDSSGQVALAVRMGGGVRWRVVDASGGVVYETTFAQTPVVAPISSGGWLVLAGTTLYRVEGGDRREVGTIPLITGRTTRMSADVLGNAYIYVGDAAGTLLSVGATGQIRWRQTYPAGSTPIAPLIRSDDGCLLYALDATGMFHVFSAATGEVVNQMQFYAGGIQNGSPPARLLLPMAGRRVLVGAGFLSAVTLDASEISNGTIQACVLG